MSLGTHMHVGRETENGLSIVIYLRLALLGWGAVNSGPHIIEDLRDILDFIQDCRTLSLFKERPWVGAQPGN